MWEMENETKTFHIPFFTATEKSKMENGCPFSIFHFPSAVENEINGMYTDPLWAVESDSIINECVNLSDLPKIVGIRQHSDSDLNSATSLGRDRSYWATWRSRSKTDVN